MKQTFKISGMACKHCQAAVTKSIEAVAGVDNVVVDLAEGKAEVEGDFDIQSVVRAVEDAGYRIKA